MISCNTCLSDTDLVGDLFTRVLLVRDRRGARHGAAQAGFLTWGRTDLKVTAGTRHSTNYSTNRIKMLGMNLDAYAAR